MILCSRNIMFWLHNIFVGSWGWIWYGEPFDSICPFVLLLHQFLLLFGAQGNPIIMFGLRTFVLSISSVLWYSGLSNDFVHSFSLLFDQYSILHELYGILGCKEDLAIGKTLLFQNKW